MSKSPEPAVSDQRQYRQFDICACGDFRCDHEANDGPCKLRGGPHAGMVCKAFQFSRHAPQEEIERQLELDRQLEAAAPVHAVEAHTFTLVHKAEYAHVYRCNTCQQEIKQTPTSADALSEHVCTAAPTSAQAGPERSPSGKAWAEWFDKLGDKATPSVINATATLVIAERDVYAATPPPVGVEEARAQALLALLKECDNLLVKHHSSTMASGWDDHECPVCSKTGKPNIFSRISAAVRAAAKGEENG